MLSVKGGENGGELTVTSGIGLNTGTHKSAVAHGKHRAIADGNVVEPLAAGSHDER